ncbi:MAG TPA: CPBP family glutamic-type intramembrane protease [Acidimicrobiales bacterium]|nr:CPBP family glutamic-type intramembrane protease [Acidimicrobiales bacterium]
MAGPTGGERPPAGWYGDPWGAAALRWWDGEAWTSGVSATGHDAPPPPTAVEGPPSFDRRALPVAIAAYVAAGVGAVVVGVGAAAVTDSDVVVIVAAQTALYGSLLTACRRTTRAYGTGSWRSDLGLRFRAQDIVTGIGTFIVASAIANAVASLVASDPDLQGSATDSLFDVSASTSVLVVVALIAVVGAPFVEEVFFRGLLLRSLASQLGPLGANLAQAVLFALAHIDPAQGWHNVDTVVRVFVLGLAFGYIAQERRRLGPGIAAHAVTNIVAVVVNLLLPLG